MKPLVFGSSGQLATHLKARLRDATFVGRAELDLARPAGIADAIGGLRPSIIVNAAAYTAVDRAESQCELAWRINAEAVAEMARAAAALDVPFIAVSTDYVFDGNKSAPYETDDAVNPVNVYGSTKLGGELAVRTLCEKHWILRASWVFSEHGANFVKTMVRLARGESSLRVVSDQQSRPTYADDLAASIERLIESPEALRYGTYHAVGGRVASWHAFAEMIVRRAFDRKLIPTLLPVLPIATAEYPMAARRPSFSALKASDELAAIGAHFDWEAGLERVLDLQ